MTAKPGSFIAALVLIPLLSAPAWSAPRPVSGEFRVNRSTEAQHHNADAAFDSAGTRALVVWDNAKLGLRGRFFGRNGSPLSDELGQVVNQQIPGLPFHGEVTTRFQPSVGFLPSGDFLVAWTEERANLSADIFYENRVILDRDVYVQRFSAAGAPAGAAFRVNPLAEGFQSNPKLLVRKGGGAVVVWEGVDRVAAADGDGIFGRLVSASGKPAGDQFRVKPEGGGASNAAIAGDAVGRFAVAWEAADGGTKGVFVRLFDASAYPVGGEVRVNSQVAGLQRRPGITASADNGWLVVWQGQVGARTNCRVFGQFLGQAGNHVGPNFRVSGDLSEIRISPSVTRFGSGYLAVWMDWEKVFPVAVVGVSLDRLGNVTSEELDINDRPIDAHHRTSLAVSANGDVLVAWEGFAPNQRRSGIQARILRAD